MSCQLSIKKKKQKQKNSIFQYTLYTRTHYRGVVAVYTEVYRAVFQPPRLLWRPLKRVINFELP